MKLENIYSVSFILALLTVLSLNLIIKHIPIENKFLKIIFGER